MNFEKYVIKVDGSGRLTLRNRRYIKKLFMDETMFNRFPQPLPIVPVIRNNPVPNVDRPPDERRPPRIRRERLL